MGVHTFVSAREHGLLTQFWRYSMLPLDVHANGKRKQKASGGSVCTSSVKAIAESE